MSRRRPAPVIACAALLAAALAWGAAGPVSVRGAESEVIRGTVDRFRPGILSLVDVRFQDGGNAGRSVMVIVNKDTEYFDGPLKTTKESITRGLKVLVKCEPAGTGRIATLVRIIGGKTP